MSRRSYGSPRVHAELNRPRRHSRLASCGTGRANARAPDAPGRVAGIHAAPGEGTRSGILPSSPPTTWSSGPSIPTEPGSPPLGNGRHRASDRGTARPTWPSSSMPSAGASWAGRSLITCVPSSWVSTPSRWPSGVVGHPPAIRRSRIAITGRPNTSWAFGASACAENGLLGSMGSIGDCFDQLRGRELLRHPPARAARRTPLGEPPELAQAIFEWIEAWYNPRRRHSYCQMLSPVDYEAAHAA